jgi:phosphatidylglycerol:prolipoprotein diacylglycerol transferase
MFFFIWLARRAKAPAGIVLWTFIALYGLFRTFVEFFREPDEQLGYLFGFLTMGQMLSIPLFLLGTTMVVLWLRKNSGANP